MKIYTCLPLVLLTLLTSCGTPPTTAATAAPITVHVSDVKAAEGDPVFAANLRKQMNLPPNQPLHFVPMR